MRLRRMLILGLGLSWLCMPAHAASFRDGPGGSEAEHGASSLHSKDSQLSDGGRFDGIWRVAVGSSPPGLEKKGDDFVPPGLEKKGDDFVPPGLEKKGDDFMPPGLVEGEDFFPPADLPGGASLIPEPTGLMLFGSGLLLAGASVRRRRNS